MKKSIRILSILMAFVMLIGSFSVMGSAYQAYKGSAIAGSYNDVDSPAFTLEQYASMGLDEVDRMLAKEQMVLDLLGLLTLDITSIDNCLGSVVEFLNTGKPLIALLGDAATLDTLCNPIKTVRRSNSDDTAVIYALLDFVAGLRDIARNYVLGTINVGILQGFISDYIFDVRELAIGLVYGMTNEGKAVEYDYMDDKDDSEKPIPAKYKDNNTGAINLLQQLLNELVLGEWKCLNAELNDPASKVNYYSYAFQSEYGETYFDTENYYYYGWVHPKDWVTVGLGGCERVAKTNGTYDEDNLPPIEYSAIDITTGAMGYDFIENLMRQAYNYVLVPVLNRDTRPWMRRLCGITYNDDFYKPTKYVGLTNPDGTPVLDEAGNQVFEWIVNDQYDPEYDGDEPETWTIYKDLLNVDGVVPTVDVPDDTTFVNYFNTILGEFVTIFLTNNTDVNGVMCSWEWDYTDDPKNGNSALFDNIVEIGKYVLCLTGDFFFSDRAEIPSAAEIMGDGTPENPGYDGQKVLALLMREILNNSVDYIYVDDSYETMVDVAYRAVEQLAWQDIPQYTYTKPVLGQAGAETEEKYYAAVIDKMLDILFDIAVYNLNQGFDMNLDVDGKNPLTDTGLLQYQGDDGSYENNLVKIAAWAISTYGDVLALDLRCDDFDGQVGTLTADDVWMDLDTIINAIIPIKGTGAWIADDIAGDGTTIVSKTFIFDYILKPIYTLNATNLAVIFERNETGAFATMNGVQIIVDILDNVFDLLFPDVFQPQQTLDQVLQNQLLGNMVYDLIGSLGYSSFTNSKDVTMPGRGGNIAATALPLVCMLLGLSDDQEFAPMEIYLPETIKAGSSSVSFDVYNGSSGINTGYTDANGNFTQDNLYTFVVDTYNVYTYDSTGEDTGALTISGLSKGATISGGDSVNVALNGSFNNDVLVKFEITYNVMGEDGTAITTAPLGTTVYSYISTESEDDDAIEKEISLGDDRFIRYEEAIYLGGGDDLDEFDGYMIRVKDNDKGTKDVVSKVDAITNDSAKPFAKLNSDADLINEVMDGTGGVYFLTPFEINTYEEEDEEGNLVTKEYERVEDIYERDENDEIVYDEETGEPNVIGQTDGVPNGKYNLSADINVNGTVKNVKVILNIYDDYGLESAFERAVLENRQMSNYDTNDVNGSGAWNAYVATLEEIARFVLKPKSAANFQTTIAATAAEKEAGYENKYEVLAEKLETAIENLEEFAENSGAAAIKEVIDEYSAINYSIVNGPDGPYKEELEYYEDGYEYFGMRDYVPHTYNRYKDALNRAMDLVNSQEIVVPAPFEDDYEPTAEELEEYNKALEAYAKAVEEMAVISSIDSIYAQHMLNLTGERLIALPAETEKLEAVYAEFAGAVPAAEEGKYTVSSLEDYRNAEAFALKTINAGEANVVPSQVNRATTELIYAWKHLTKGADYSALDAAITEAEKITAIYGTVASEQSKYTENSYAAFIDAYNAAKNLDRDLGDTDDGNQQIAEAATKLTSAMAPENLIDKSTLSAEFEITTEDPGVFYDATYSWTFAPYLDVDSPFMNDTIYTPDGELFDAYLLTGVDVWDEETLLMAFDNPQNARFEVTPDPENGAYGTGTVIKIYNASTDELAATYVVAVHGDTNGNYIVDIDDTYIIALHEAGIEELWNDYRWGACDVNFDFIIDVNDTDIIKACEAGDAYDMITGEEV